MKGLRKYLTPFAPDQSGAVSVLYELGGMLVICDAGGCTGMYVDSMSQDGLKQEVRYSVRGFVIWMRYSEEMTDWLQNLQMRQKSWM